MLSQRLGDGDGLHGKDQKATICTGWEKQLIVNASGLTRPRGQARGIGSAAWGSARNGRAAES